MKKYTKLSVQWFYNLLERGECDIMDFKEQLEDKMLFGKSLKNFAPKYDETARDVVASIRSWNPSVLFVSRKFPSLAAAFALRYQLK